MTHRKKEKLTKMIMYFRHNFLGIYLIPFAFMPLKFFSMNLFLRWILIYLLLFDSLILSVSGQFVTIVWHGFMVTMACYCQVVVKILLSDSVISCNILEKIIIFSRLSVFLAKHSQFCDENCFKKKFFDEIFLNIFLWKRF